MSHAITETSGGNLKPLFTHTVNKVVLIEAELREHLESANAVLLLLSLVHAMGDASLLDKYEGKVGSSPAGLIRWSEILDAMKGVTGVPAVAEKILPVTEEVRQELIEQLVAALTKDEQSPYLGVEDKAIFSRMANLAAGVHVADTYIPMYLEQAGFVPDQRAVKPTKAPPATLDIAIIGAGMTGLDAAVKAADRGFAYKVFDLEAGVGGLWWTQTYPGVGVDTPSMYYSLSFEVTPDWSNLYPTGAEYGAYLRNLAAKYRVADHLHLNTEITRMKWLEDEQVWELTAVSRLDRSSKIYRAAAVITGAGHLCRPKYPDVEGRKTFAGESVHTARWNKNLKLEGKRVGVIGAGAAAVQVISSIAGKVSHLTVFQRQPHWIMPNAVGDGVVSASEVWRRRNLPYYLQWSRFVAFWTTGDETGYPTVRVDKEWMKDHPDSISPHNAALRQMCLNYIHRIFGEGTEMAKKLTPDFAFGGKRPVRDPADFGPGGYYYALSQPHVDVVTSSLSLVVPEGIVTADGTLTELDVIIYASGMTIDWLSTIEIVGRDDRRLSDVWANNNPRTYLGGTVPGFPNLFVNDGPNTGLGHAGGHNFMSETVNHYAFECLQMVVEEGGTSIEVTQKAHDDHNERIEETMKGSIWTYVLGAHNYYRNEAGRVYFPNPWRLVELWHMSQVPDRTQFVIMGGEEAPKARLTA